MTRMQISSEPIEPVFDGIIFCENVTFIGPYSERSFNSVAFDAIFICLERAIDHIVFPLRARYRLKSIEARRHLYAINHAFRIGFNSHIYNEAVSLTFFSVLALVTARRMVKVMRIFKNCVPI